MLPWEEVFMVIKKHWIAYFILWFYFIIWVIITIILFLILWFNFNIILINIVFWQFLSIFLFIEWLNFELDMYVVTNNRVIWIEQVSFLNRTVTECNLWQVQEVNSKTTWLFWNLLGFWTLSVQTAWNMTTLKMNLCPDSMQTARKMLNIVYDYRENEKANKSNNEY